MQLVSADDPGQAREALRRTDRPLRCLIAVGGDSTLSEMAVVSMELQVPLLPVPAGFGNLVATTLGYRASVGSVLQVLERGTVHWIDAGHVEGSVFLASHSFGFMETVRTAVESGPALPRSRRRRYLRYWQAAARSIVGIPLPALRVEADGRCLADGAVMVVVANMPTYRGFLPLTPGASPFDGLLDVFVVPAMPKGSLIALLLAFLAHAPGRWHAARCCRAARVRVTTDDGTPHDLHVLPGAVPFLRLPGPRSPGPPRRLAS